jgi:Cu-Zn family superoxide dismutase
MSRYRTLYFGLLTSAVLAACNAPNEPATPIEPVAPQASSPIEPLPPAPSATPAIGPSAPIVTAAPTPQSVRIKMTELQGSGISGALTASPAGNGVRIHGRLSRSDALAEHAIHVHENGDCSAPDGSSAGNHFNPAGASHGHPDRVPHHAGDLPNLKSDPDGQLIVDIYDEELQLGTGSATDILGRALVVHEKADDYATQPSGDSGGRIACGVIRTVDAG